MVQYKVHFPKDLTQNNGGRRHLATLLLTCCLIPFVGPLITGPASHAGQHDVGPGLASCASTNQESELESRMIFQRLRLL
jgi:hypothetical protein